jgi:hypothetical protein
VLRLFWLDDPGFETLWGEKGFLFFNEYQGSFPEVNQPRREADHSTLSGAETKKEWRYTSTPPIHLHGVDRENFTFIFFCLFLVLCYNLKLLL